MEVVGYKFKNVNLLYQTFTHSSFHQVNKSEPYKRLEYVGDSVLHLLMDNRLRAAKVDIEKLARIAIKYNFHKYLRHKKPILKCQCSDS
ncbi:hypothetical protein H5410_028183 [Solanum commersonii]|uniref:RNase III domain-containing protein n=1 Tax=Solanum commersonii TaxID=4109 RepID=A0A9J5Z176_SOLCO|nr:hypothetical protein H5410_028183 [Solanum commersonii]